MLNNYDKSMFFLNFEYLSGSQTGLDINMVQNNIVQNLTD